MGEFVGKYSFYCKNCGYTFFSDSKNEVKEARKNHKIVEKRGMMIFKFCPLVPINKEATMFARPDLVRNFQQLFV